VSRHLVLGLLAVVNACASSGSNQPAKTERNVITRVEILGSSFATADLYQAIRSLRPHLLAPPASVRSRATTATPVAVYVDGMRQAGLDALRTLRASDVEEVRYLDPMAAQSELGPAASGGAMLIKLRKP